MRAFMAAVMVLLCGCTQVQMLPYLDQVMVLQDLGADKQAQAEMIAKIDAGFDRMQKAIADNTMGQYKTQAQIIKAFGPPIIAEQEVVEGKIYTQALYRYAIATNNPDKVHIFYDKEGRVVKWERLP